MAGGVPPCGGPVLLLMPLAPPSALLLLFIYFFSQLQEVEMDSWVELLENNTGSSELDADEFNFGAMPTEQASTEIPTEASPPLKTGKKNKKRTRNFSDKEDILLASAWLEVSMDPVQSIDQTRSSYWQRIHEYYHKHKTFESDRNISSLSHRWGIIQGSVSKFCSWYSQVLRSNQSSVIEQDRVQSLIL